MRNRDRWLRLVQVVSVTTVLVAPAFAAAQSPATRDVASEADVCVYLQGNKTDTPEIGPLPCDTSRAYVIGHSGLGSSRIPENSEFSFGPKSHLGRDTSRATSIDASDATSASPSATPSPDPSVETEAP
jgi:hypothetical protein